MRAFDVGIEHAPGIPLFLWNTIIPLFLFSINHSLVHVVFDVSTFLWSIPALAGVAVPGKITLGKSIQLGAAHVGLNAMWIVRAIS